MRQSSPPTPSHRPSLSSLRLRSGGLTRFPTEAGISEELEAAINRKRAWEEEEEDDLDLLAESMSIGARSAGSYASRRKKVWRENQRANARAEARQRHRPEFTNIRVENGGFFFRHYNPTWKFAAPDPFLQRFMAEGYQLPISVDTDKMTMTLPCDAAQMHHLGFFDRVARSAPSHNRRAYNEALKRVKAIMRLDTPLIFPHAEDLASVRFRPKKYAGNEYRMNGFQTRAEAHPMALVDAQLAWAQLMAGEHVEPHMVRLGGRGKLTMKTPEELKEAGVPKGRLILMLSQRDLLLLGNVEQLLTNAYRDPDYPVAIGMGWYGGNVTTFMERLIPSAKLFCMDAEKYDASLDPWLLQDGVDILRQQFVGGEHPRYDKYWEFVMDSLVGAPIARDDGWLMFKEVGSTSGHCFNTLVQSICTLIIGYAALFDLVPEGQWKDVWEATEIDSLGDDNITGIPDFIAHITAEQYGEATLRMTGINWLGDKSFGTNLLVDEEEPTTPGTEEGWFQGAQYLGKFFRKHTVAQDGLSQTVVIPFRPFVETFGRMYYPERTNNTPERAYCRAMGNLLDAYGNPYSAAFLNAFLDWLEPQCDMIPSTWNDDTVQDAARDYGSSEVLVPKLRRWSMEEWLELTLCTPEVAADMYEIV